VTTPINFENAFNDNDRMFTELIWIDDKQLLVRIQNRVQDTQRIYMVFQDNGMVWRNKLIRDEKASEGAWINRRQAFHLIPPSAKENRNYSSYIEVYFC
jgi:hypothetical protein